MSTDANGRTVVHMWAAGRPDPADANAGFPLLKTARHAEVYVPTRETGAYNHHPALLHHDGRFHLVWSNHPHGEDGPGQRVLYATSTDGTTWSDAVEIFAPPQPVGDWHGQGLAHTAGSLLVEDGTIFAVALLHANVGFTDFDQTLPPVPDRDADHPCRARHGYSPVARAVGADGAFGPVFPLGGNQPETLAYPLEAPPAAAAALAARFASPADLTHWDFEGTCGLPDAWDGHRICEPVTYRRPDGQWVLLARDTAYTHRMLVSLRDEAAGAWTPAEPTDIPDSPSLASAATLPDGRVLLVGNQVAPAFDNPDEVSHYARTPLTVALSDDGKVFDRAYALRSGPHDWVAPPNEVGGRGAGYQYPDARVVGDRLWVACSIGKERIAVSSAALDELA